MGDLITYIIYQIFNLNKNSLDRLHTYEYRTNIQNSKANIVYLGRYLLGLVGLPNVATIVGTASNMMQSGLDVVETMNYSYQNYKYLVNNQKIKTVRTRIKYRRFFDGIRMHPGIYDLIQQEDSKIQYISKKRYDTKI